MHYSKSLILSILISTTLITACSEDERPQKIPDNPEHIWSDQVGNLNQARDVADAVGNQQGQQEQRIEELNIIQSRE